MTESRPNVGHLQSRRNVSALVEALRHTDPEVRKRAALALRALDAMSAVSTLKEVLRTEQDEQVRRHLSATLNALDQRIDVDALIAAQDVAGLTGALKSRHQDDVIRAARALGTLQDHSAVEPLVILFHNPSSPPNVRLAAAEALLDLQSAPAVVTLLGALRRESWQVRRNAAAVLGQIQATWAVEPLAAALDDAHPVVRRTAAAALRRIGSADAINALRARFTEQAPRPESKPVKLKTAPPPESAPPPKAKQAPVIDEPPVQADDTVPSAATRTRRAASAAASGRAAPVERVHLSSAETRPSGSSALQDDIEQGTPAEQVESRDKAEDRSGDEERPSRVRRSIDKLISFFSRD